MGRRNKLKELIPMEVIVTTAVESSSIVVREIFMGRNVSIYVYARRSRKASNR
jgi:hypothetical protein